MSALKEAMKDAGLARYMPTKHAIDRATMRFGINAGQVAEWANARIRNATDKIPQGDNTVLCVTNDARILIDDDRKTIVTVYYPIKVDFLRPALERELRKLRREYIRAKRALELQYAETLGELSEMAINRARARNPQTRELIADRMADKQSEIDGLVLGIERLDDEYNAKKRAIELISE